MSRIGNKIIPVPSGVKIQIKSDLDDIDSPDDTGAETAWFEQIDLLLRAVIGCERLKRHKNGWV